MANHRGVKLCKAKGQYPKNRMANVQMSWTVFTDLFHTSWLLSWHPLPLLQLWFCSTWSFITASRARQATMIVKTRLASPFIRQITHGKSWKITHFQKLVAKITKESFPWPYFYGILLSFAKALHLGKSLSLFFITDLNTASLVERSLTTTISYISSASVTLECWQNL